MTQPWLSIEGIRRDYGSRVVFRDVWFGVERGEFVALIGHSGCGKTPSSTSSPASRRPTPA